MNSITNLLKAIPAKSLLAFCIVFAICTVNTNLLAKDSNENNVRILISNSTRVKKDYILTEKECLEHASRRSDFGKIKWTLPEIVKKAEKHIEEKLMAEISPSIKCPPKVTIVVTSIPWARRT